MVKRKASAPALSTEPSRRRLRSDASARETLPDPHGKPPGIPPAVAQALSDPRQTRSSVLKSSVKEKKAAPSSRNKGNRHLPPSEQRSTRKTRNTAPKSSSGVGSEQDELDLLPKSSRPATPTKRPASRVFMQSVEIVTPKFLSRAIASTRSPVPSSSNVSSKEKYQVMLPDSLQKRVVTPPLAIPTPVKTSSKPDRPKSTPRSVTSMQVASSSKKRTANTQVDSTIRLPTTLPHHLHPCLNEQREAIMAAIRNPPEMAEDEGSGDEDSPPTNSVAYDDLCDLLSGTINRGEGNSCLLIGPRGSGKTRLVNRALAHVSDKVVPIVIQLSGYAQRDDRLAMREIARQLAQQTGKIFVSEDDDEADEGVPEADPMTLPPPAHLPALISVLPSQVRPVVVILDAFDCFALHGRQALLYCLLDTAQSCRVGEGNNGVAVVGLTSRVDTINLLEKRVKSRFSGRMFRTAGPRTSNDWIKLVRTILTVPVRHLNDEWTQLWEASVEQLLADRKVIDSLLETWGLTKDVRVLARIFATPVLELNPSSPFLSANQIISSITTQRFPVRFSYLSTLAYPSICLLIAAIHSQTAGHDTFTFEMLHQTFRDQVRTSMSAPVQVDGGSIGMVKCGRHTLMGAFEQLCDMKVFMAIAAPSATSNVGVSKEFVKYRCAVDHEDVRRAVDKTGQTNLKKWFSKSQQSG